MNLKQLARDSRGIAARIGELRAEVSATAEEDLQLCHYHRVMVDKILTNAQKDLENFADGAEKKEPCLGPGHPQEVKTGLVQMLEAIFGPGAVVIMDDESN